MSVDEHTPVLRSCIKLPLKKDELIEVIAKAKDYAIMHGAAMRSKTSFSPDSLNVSAPIQSVLPHTANGILSLLMSFKFAPFVLVPSSFPRKEFEKAIALQPIINRLMHNVAHDEEFITTTLAETIKVDEFTANLFNIYRKVLALGFTQVRHLVRHQSRPPTPRSLTPTPTPITPRHSPTYTPTHLPPCPWLAPHLSKHIPLSFRD